MDSINAITKLNKISQISENLLARFATLRNQKPFYNKKIRNIVKSFVKKSKDHKEINIKKLINNKSIENEITSEFLTHKINYEFLKDLLLFNSVTHNFLIDISVSPLILKLEINPDLVMAVMDTIVNFSKVTVAISSQKEFFAGSFVYLIGFELANGEREKNYNDVLKTLVEMPNALIRNQCHFINFGIHISMILSDCEAVYLKWDSVQTYDSTNIFSPQFFCQNPEQSKINCRELVLYNRLNEWVSFGLLMSFKELITPKMMNFLRRSLANTQHYILGYNLKVKIADAYYKMADYANALKLSSYKQLWHKEVSGRAEVMEKSMQKLSVLQRNIANMANYLNEEPHAHALYFETSLAALETLRNEMLILLANMSGETIKDNITTIAQKKLTEGVSLHIKLKRSVKIYSPLIKEHFKNILKTQCSKKLGKLCKELEQFSIFSGKSEKLDNLRSLFDLISGDNFEDFFKEITERISHAVTVSSFIINQETQNELIRKKSLSGEENDSKEKSKKLKTVSESLLEELHCISKYLHYVYDFEQILERSASLHKLCLDSSMCKIFIEALEEKNSVLGQNLFFLETLSCESMLPREITEEKATVAIVAMRKAASLFFHSLENYASKYRDCLNNAFSKGYQLNESLAKISLDKNVCQEIIQRFSDIKRLKINFVEIFVSNYIKENILHSFSTALKNLTPKKSTEPQSQGDTPLDIYLKISTLTRLMLQLDSSGSLQLKENFGFFSQNQLAHPSPRGFLREYFDLIMGDLLSEKTVFSLTEDEFVDIESGELAEFARDGAILLFCKTVGLVGIFALREEIYRMVEAHLTEFAKSLEEDKQEKSEKSSKRRGSVKSDRGLAKAADLGKLLVWLEKLGRFADELSSLYIPFLHQTARYSIKASKPELLEDDAVSSAVGAYLWPRNLLEKAVRRNKLLAFFAGKAKTLAIWLNVDFILNAHFSQTHGVFTNNAFMALHSFMEANLFGPEAKSIHGKILENCVSFAVKQYNTEPSKNSPGKSKNLHLFRFAEFASANSPHLTQHNFDGYFPSVVFIE